MFSYRHAFHAGNHADVLKHIVLVHILDYLCQKEAPFWYIDTHAGAGLYDLRSEWPSTSKEFLAGIQPLWLAQNAPEGVQAYRQAVAKVNPDGHLRYYPGSAFLAGQKIRTQDRMRLFELHPNEFFILQEQFAQQTRWLQKRTMFYGEDGFKGLMSLLPPTDPVKRACVCIDPSYEDKKDYARVIQMVQGALQRFAQGTYLIWYPLVQRAEREQMQRRLQDLEDVKYLHVAIKVKDPYEQGLFGSGVFVINPPYTLLAMLEKTVPFLLEHLAEPGQGDYSVYYHEPKKKPHGKNSDF